MDLRQLKYFVAVAEKLNFTEAAKTLFVAQSAVSQQISELERQLGMPLFTRNRRIVQLTPAGNVLYCEATGLLKRFDEVVENTLNAHLGYKGHLRIGYIGYGDRKWLPIAIKAFQSKYPEVTLEVERYHQAALIKSLKENNIDIAITFSFGISGVEEALEQWETRHIYTETLCAVVSKDNPLTQHWANQKMPLSALAAEPFIIQNRHESPQGYDKTLQICSAHGFSPKILNTPNLVQTVLVLVEAQLGVAILPESLATYAGPNVVFLPLALESSLAQYAIVAAWKAKLANPALKHFIEIIEETSMI